MSSMIRTMKRANATKRGIKAKHYSFNKRDNNTSHGNRGFRKTPTISSIYSALNKLKTKAENKALKGVV